MLTTVTSEDPLQQFQAQTAKSREIYQKAKEVMPGGVTANIKYFAPYPIIMEEAEGAWLKDVDGNKYVDYLLAYGALLLGHGHHKITQAVIRQMVNKGTTIFGTPHELEIEMAQRIQQLYPSMEKIRYTNSGTEATLLALRIAYAYTGKSKIAKFEGHYHGGYDQVLWSINPSLTEAGPIEEPNTVADSAGLSDFDQQNTLILPFNNLEATCNLLRKYKDEVACVVLEPVQAGFIPANQEFMVGLRKVTEELGIILFFDEVKTGFRISMGGAQEKYEIKPDLTALGKVLGGGFPVGAVGGKTEIMEVCSPLGKSDLFEMKASTNKKDVLFHSGTYNGHPSILAAGLATLDVLQSGDNYQRILENTKKLRRALENVLRYYQIPAQTIGMGTIFNVVIGTEKVENYRDLLTIDTSTRKELDYHLLNLGVYSKPLNRYSLSFAHGDREIQHTIDAYEVAIKRLLMRKGKK